MNETQQNQLEALVDAHGLYDVATALAKICREKSDHLATNWHAPNAAKRWDKAGTVFDKTWAALRKIQLP